MRPHRPTPNFASRIMATPSPTKSLFEARRRESFTKFIQDTKNFLNSVAKLMRGKSSGLGHRL
jgi:hypothetical protein